MKTTKSTNRRNFLLAAGLGSAGVAGALISAGNKPVARKGLAEAGSQPSGYHASEHILKYYKTTKV